MSFYEDLVMQTQMNYSKYYHVYASGGTPYQLADKKTLPYHEQIMRLTQEIRDADCIVVGGASGLSAAGAVTSTMRTTPPSANTSASLRRSIISRALLMGCSASGTTGPPSGLISPPSCTPPRPPRCASPIST